MKKTLETLAICGERVAYKTTCGFNRVFVDFYFPHRVCQELEFTIVSDKYCQFETVQHYRNYTAVRFTVTSTEFDWPFAVAYHCTKYFKKVSWMPIAGHTNFWKELDEWFKLHNVG